MEMGEVCPVTRAMTGSRAGTMAAILVVACCLCLAPALAGTRVTSGSPELSAAVLGANEFSPGTETNLPVSIQNSGLIQFEFTYPTTLTPADLPNTAKLMTVALEPGESPITILSDPQMVGDLKGGSQMTVIFKIRIPSDAASGTYNLPLKIHYTYLAYTDQYGQDTLQYFYQEKDVALDLAVRIEPEIILEVVSLDSGNITAGSEGFVTAELRNLGREDGTDAVLVLSPAQNSPLKPSVGSVYIGNFPAGSTVAVPFKVSTSTNAENQDYPMNLTVQYRDMNGNFVTSAPVVVGIPVSARINFTVVSSPPEVTPGGLHRLTIVFMNAGSAPVYSALAQIYPVDPFTTSDDTAFLGDMAPGATSTAVFDVTVDGSATVKPYSMDSEIRFRDALDNDQVSDRVPVTVNVVAPTGIQAVLTNPVFIVVIVIVIVAAAILIRTGMKKRKE